jgi:hypothetical protein
MSDYSFVKERRKPLPAKITGNICTNLTVGNRQSGVPAVKREADSIGCFAVVNTLSRKIQRAAGSISAAVKSPRPTLAKG